MHIYSSYLNLFKSYLATSQIKGIIVFRGLRKSTKKNKKGKRRIIKDALFKELPSDRDTIIPKLEDLLVCNTSALCLRSRKGVFPTI